MCFQQYSNRFCHTLKTSNGFVNVNNCTSVKSTESFMPTLHGFYVQRGVIFNGFHTCTHTQCLANIRFLFTFQKQVGPNPSKSSQTSRSVRCSMRQCNATTTPRRRKDDDKLSSFRRRGVVVALHIVVVAWASIPPLPDRERLCLCVRRFGTRGHCGDHIALWTRVWLALTGRRLGLIARDSRHSVEKCHRCLQPYTSRYTLRHLHSHPTNTLQTSSRRILGLYASSTLWCGQSGVTKVRRYMIGWTRCQSRRVIGCEAVTSRSSKCRRSWLVTS